ncbi:MAG: hypothetical protein QOD29_2369 [Alphaproteobacteria bacterium]|nr:hypothetical protein [Alphaproteobacteria bacterium]
MFEGLAKIIQLDVAANHGNLFRSRVRHDIREEPDGVSRRLLGRLKPQDPREEIEIQRWPVPKLQRYCSAAIQRKLFRCLRQLRPKPQLGWRQNIDIGVEWNGEPPLGSLLVTARESVVRLAIVL